MILTAAAFVYLRPVMVALALRDVYLYAIGLREADVQVGGHRIHYLVGGEGPPLVVVHGVASRAKDAAPVFPGLMRIRRVYALDLLGYGDSEQPVSSDYSVATEAEIVRGFMDAMDLRDADVMGISMGGWIALKVAADHPERVRKLVLVASAGLRFQTAVRPATFTPTTPDGMRALFALQTDKAALVPEFVLRDFLRHKATAWVVRRSLTSMLSLRDSLDGKLRRVTMPVLLVWGTKDRLVPYSVAGMLRKEMPHAELVTLEGCGHLAIAECRDRAIPAIVNFLGVR